MEPSSISLSNESGTSIPEQELERLFAKALDIHEVSGGPVHVLFTTDEEIRRLNQTFRGIDEATDVLTFPGDGFANASLGDVAISIPYASRQAKARGIPLDRELGYLLIHAALHLAGFDDEEPQDRDEMLRQMASTAEAIGLPVDPEWYSLLHAEEAS